MSERDFNCSEMSGEVSDRVDGLLVGNAVKRALSHPKHNKYGMNILSGSERCEENNLSMIPQRIQISAIVADPVAYING